MSFNIVKGILCFCIYLFANSAFAVGETSNTVLLCQQISDGVNSEVSSILGIDKGSLLIDEPFSRQSKPGDALHVVEVIMAVEERFGIEINDEVVEKIAGSFTVKTLPQTLTIKMLHTIVKSAAGCA